MKSNRIKANVKFKYSLNDCGLYRLIYENFFFLNENVLRNTRNKKRKIFLHFKISIFKFIKAINRIYSFFFIFLIS